jgi:hypothetical protein
MKSHPDPPKIPQSCRAFKVTGHLCSIPFREAAELGIDNLEHGFVIATDFNADKTQNMCPPSTEKSQAVFQALTPEPAASRLD